MGRLCIKVQPLNYLFLLYRHECFTGKYTTMTRKIHKNYILDTSGLFSTISRMSLSIM